MTRASSFFTSVVLLLSTTALVAQQPGPDQTEKAQTKGNAATKKAATNQEPAAEKAKPKSSTDEDLVVTHHQITIDGKVLKYTLRERARREQGREG